MKTATYKGIELRFEEVDIENGFVYIPNGEYIFMMSEEDFNNLVITE